MSGSALYIGVPELAETFDTAFIERLLTAFGGQRIYVSGRLTSDTPIVKALGIDDAKKLSDFCATGIGGLTIELPLGRANSPTRLITMAADSSLSEREIARACGVHTRTVRRARAKLRAKGKFFGYIVRRGAARDARATTIRPTFAGEATPPTRATPLMVEARRCAGLTADHPLRSLALAVGKPPSSLSEKLKVFRFGSDGEPVDLAVACGRFHSLVSDLKVSDQEIAATIGGRSSFVVEMRRALFKLPARD